MFHNFEQTNSDEKYVKRAILNGQHETECYLNLGSSCTMMRLADAEKLNIDFVKNNNLDSFSGYGGGVVKPLGITKMNISIDDVCADVEIFIVPNQAQNIPVLVGHSYTEQPHIEIRNRATGLNIFNVDVLNTITPEKNTKVQLKVTEDV